MRRAEIPYGHLTAGASDREERCFNGEHSKPDGPTALKCLTLAAKIKGMLVNRHEVGDPGKFARMSDDELEATLKAHAKALGLPEDAIKHASNLKCR